MSQTSTINTVAYDGNGSTTAFAFSHPLNDGDDLKVTVITESTGAESVRAVGTGSTEYAIVLADDKSSATVTFVTAPLSTEAVVLDRVTLLTQESTYSQHNTIEGDLDKGTQSDLSLKAQVDRCLKLPLADTVAHDGNSDTTTSPDIPTVINADAGDVLVLNSGKTAFEWSAVAGGNATHTGEVTGATVLTVDPTAISNKALVTGASGDMILVQDATDGALKRVDFDDFAGSQGNLTGHITSVGLATVLGSFTASQLNTAISDDTVMLDLVDDTTPQLGGELDCNGSSIGHTLQTGTGDGTTTIDWGAGNIYKHTFGAQNETFTFTAPTKPGTFILILVQDSVGSRTATWPGTVDWPSNTAPTLTTTATTGTDIIHFIYDGTNYYGTSAADFS